MDLEKIGKFIMQCRKENNLTQEELASTLGLTAKAISKWECGHGLPDVSVMQDLCCILKVNLMDLLNGEKTDVQYYIHKVGGSKRKKLTLNNALKKRLNWDLPKEYTIKKIKDIKTNEKSATFEVEIKGYEIIETENYIEVVLEITDDTGTMEAIVLTASNLVIKDILEDMKVGDKFLLNGQVTLNDNFIGDKLLIVKGIEKIRG